MRLAGDTVAAAMLAAVGRLLVDVAERESHACSMRNTTGRGGRTLVTLAVALMGAAGCARTFSAEVRQPNPLEHAFGVTAEPPIARVLQADELEHFIGPRPQLPTAQPA